MKTVKGDMIEMALNGQFDMIIQGCNCFNTMGAGLAKQIADKLPVAVKADNCTLPGDIEKLGGVTCARYTDENTSFLIINAYTQYEPGPCAEYAAIDRALKLVYDSFHDQNLRIAVPEIGCGIGGLKIEVVKQIIERRLAGLDVTLVEFAPPAPAVMPVLEDFFPTTGLGNTVESSILNHEDSN